MEVGGKIKKNTSRIALEWGEKQIGSSVAFLDWENYGNKQV